MSIKTNTYVAERRELMQQWQRVVCFLLAITAEAHNHLIFQTGTDYLKHYVPDDQLRAAIAKSRLFWAWWRNQFAHRDQQFINSVERGDKPAQLLENYLWLHNPKVLSQNIHPNSVVLNDTYAVMIGQLIKEEVAA